MKITLNWNETTQAIIDGLVVQGKVKYKKYYDIMPQIIRNKNGIVTDIQIEIEESNKEKK